jgi:hypothetical protein
MIESDDNLKKNKLDFVVVGASKCGTTTLHDILRSSNCLSLPEKKDFHFFDYDDNYSLGMDWYWNHFDLNTDCLVGEVAANYFYISESRERIIESITQEVKVIVILRDPVERAISEYFHHKRNGTLTKSLDYYLETPSAPTEMGLKYTPWHLIIERSQFRQWLELWEEKFNKSNLLVLHITDLNDLGKLERKLCDFLLVDSLSLVEQRNTNKAFKPRFNIINRLLKGDNLFKSVSRKLLPTFFFRNMIKKYIRKLNSKSSNHKPHISEATKAKLSKILKSDTLFYEKLKEKT